MLKIRIDLFLWLTSDNDIFLSQRARRLYVERNIGKRSLETNTRGHIYVENKFLQGLFDLFVFETVKADKRCQKGIEV